jgi:hypothetical protein
MQLLFRLKNLRNGGILLRNFVTKEIDLLFTWAKGMKKAPITRKGALKSYYNYSTIKL